MPTMVSRTVPSPRLRSTLPVVYSPEVSGSISLPLMMLYQALLPPLPMAAPQPSRKSSAPPAAFTWESPEMVISLPLQYNPPPMPAPFIPPLAVTSPPEMVISLPSPLAPPPMPAPYIPPLAVTSPPVMVISFPLCEKPPPMPAPRHPPLAVSFPLPLSEPMVRLPSLDFSTPA